MRIAAYMRLMPAGDTDFEDEYFLALKMPARDVIANQVYKLYESVI